MKKYYIYILLAVFLIAGCSSSKQKLNKVEPQMSKLQTSKSETADKTDQTKQEKGLVQTDQKQLQQLKAQADKQAKQKKKEEAKKKKQQEKESLEKKKQQDKEKKLKQKQQDDLIKNAEKEEKKRIEEERRKEREELLNSIKGNKNQTDDSDYQDDVKKTVNVPVDTLIGKDSVQISLEDLLEDGKTDTLEIVKYDKEEEDDTTPSFLKKATSLRKKNKTADTVKAESEKELTPMDKIISMMDGDANASSSAKASNGKNKTKKSNFIKKTWNEMFPKHVDRDIPYANIYKEEPKNILILYPWNRSDYDKASDMLLIMASKELGKKGYYVYSAVSSMETHKNDSTFSSRYTKLSDIKNLGKKYGADAVMSVTVFRFDNPYWSSATKAVAHYTLISTKTLDTLFYRQVEFNYDTPIPPKEYHDKDMELDEEQVYDLGVMEQMQIYAFRDIPYGPYHKKYKKDRKKFSNEREVKYKINVRPS